MKLSRLTAKPISKQPWVNQRHMGGFGIHTKGSLICVLVVLTPCDGCKQALPSYKRCRSVSNLP